MKTLGNILLAVIKIVAKIIGYTIMVVLILLGLLILISTGVGLVGAVLAFLSGIAKK